MAMPNAHLSQEVYDFIQARKHQGQTITGFLSELIQKHYSNHNRNSKGQFLPSNDPIQGGINGHYPESQIHRPQQRHHKPARPT